jgi:hypothetical protein
VDLANKEAQGKLPKISMISIDGQFCRFNSKLRESFLNNSVLFLITYPDEPVLRGTEIAIH